VRRVLGVCCVDASRVPADVVEAHIELTQRLDRADADAAYAYAYVYATTAARNSTHYQDLLLQFFKDFTSDKELIEKPKEA